MSYETAPATEMLATQCACCGRPLVDAISVETGIGPHCRAKHGYGESSGEPDWSVALSHLGAVPDGAGEVWGVDAHRAANVIVHEIACRQNGERSRSLVCALSALGFSRLASRCAERAGTVVHVIPEGNDLLIKGPYSELFIEAVRRVPGRRWDPLAKANRVPATQRRALWTALVQGYPPETVIVGKTIRTLSGA